MPKNQKVPYQIVIGTPGTLMDWAIKMKVIDLKKIKVFVLDEADVMIATQGHQDQSLRIKRSVVESAIVGRSSFCFNWFFVLE